MAITVFTILFVLAIVIGFLASGWKRADLNKLNEWGLAGRRFGIVLSWFLMGGDLYTAYTFIAIPALVFGAGALGFFGIAYATIAFPLLFLIFPRLWRVAHRHGYVTASEYVRGRFGNRWLALAVGVTGILATMPYIALQLVGTQVVFGAIGYVGGGWLTYLPLILSFIILATFSITSGLRASAFIAILKGVLVFLTVIVAIIVIPNQLGGYAAIFGKVPVQNILLASPTAANWGAFSSFSTLALGSAFALFLYPHAVTGLLSSASGRVIEQNAIVQPVFNIVLWFLAIFGFAAVAAGVSTDPTFASGFKTYGPSYALLALIMKYLPGWFVGIAFAAIAIGALVPASVMAIGSANIITRDIWGEFVHAGTSESKQIKETTIAKVFALLMVVAALFFVIAIPLQYVVQFQLLGGIWVIQTFPAVAMSLFVRRWLTGWGVLVGWLVGMVVGTWMVASLGFTASVYPLQIFGITIPCYVAVASGILNLVVAIVLTPIFRAAEAGSDETALADYAAEPAE
jgi:solute:Na+ symporter, SSS family